MGNFTVTSLEEVFNIGDFVVCIGKTGYHWHLAHNTRGDHALNTCDIIMAELVIILIAIERPFAKTIDI
jgi:hypothetical protein